jgi:type IV secretory pathway VirD2 relaxase
MTTDLDQAMTNIKMRFENAENAHLLFIDYWKLMGTKG